ncbi:YybH family protein [Mesorhizobium temperatum]|uniref:DUF4440 domain-containing protein n=1 Tax=Mesorhizobium temperatum TaxID=241416 RepID=A0A271L8U4_9HYPH|nr:SgcJ/EcaC family oxidoreductase [Mesorhizobium temperatum]PAQ04539.1 hypothetical protein CIT26_33425 [Mesorhizobium temperatum]
MGAIHPVDMSITQREDEMRLVKSFAFAAVLLISSALSASAQSAREDIEAALTKFTDAFNSGNAAAVAQIYTEDAALLPPDGKRVDGRKGVEEFWQGAIKGGMKNFTLKALEVEESENLAYEVGAFTLDVPSKDGALSTVAGKYIDVWKKGDDGTWRLHRDIWNLGAAQ